MHGMTSATSGQRAASTMAPDRAAEALRASALFDHLPPERLAALADRGGRRRPFAAGQTIFSRGAHGHALFVLISGRVRIDGEAADGHPVVLDTLTRPGAVLGETAVLGFTRRECTATAETDAWLVEVEKAVVERLDRELGGHAARDGIRARARRRAFRVFCAGHVYLQALEPATCTALADAAGLRLVRRGEALFTAGEPADRVVLIRVGLARLWRARPGRDSVLGYFNPGDVFVPPDLMHGVARAEDARWPDTLTAMLDVEAFEIDRAAFAKLPAASRQIVVQAVRSAQDKSEGLRALLDPRAEADGPAMTLAALAPGSTVFGVLEAIERAGALEARSLLTIDLETCVRCGNCVRACQSRHGHARMVRRGWVVAPRADIDRPGTYRRTLLPSSCQHCEKPECMVDCPTGAIHRKATGEVAIERDRCIGCGHCARNCPWGNIAMVPAPRAGEGLLHQLLAARLGGVSADDGDPFAAVDLRRVADKCDLCAGYGQANCVHNCPTGAILRVDPARFFDELSPFVERSGPQAGAATVTDRPAVIPGWLLWGGVALVALGLGALAALGGFSARSVPGRWVGGAALACMLGAVALGARRKMASRRRQLGTYRTWMRIHLALGALACLGAILHAGPHLGGPLTAALWIFAALELALGLSGLWLYRWIPQALGRLEGDSQLEDELEAEAETRARRIEELGQHVGPDGRTRAERSIALALPRSSVWACLLGRADHDALRAQADARIARAGEDAELRRLHADGLRLVEIAAARWVYRLRRLWLVAHIGLALALTFGALAHVATVIRFWGLGR